jgi:hypothetical protein
VPIERTSFNRKVQCVCVVCVCVVCVQITPPLRTLENKRRLPCGRSSRKQPLVNSVIVNGRVVFLSITIQQQTTKNNKTTNNKQQTDGVVDEGPVKDRM